MTVVVKPKVYPSASAFMEGERVYTDYNAGCLRKIGYNALGVHEPFPVDTAAVGAANEEAYEATLKGKGTTYEREVPVVVDLGAGISLSGRVDFIVNGTLIELKSTRSTSKRTKLRAGAPTTENIAQLVAYMVATEAESAVLLYTYIDDKKKTTENYEFAVKIAEDGSITLNDEDYRYDVHSYLMHRRSAVHLLSRLIDGTGNPIASTVRPVNHNAAFGSPCGYCCFRDACARLDGGAADIDETIRLAQRSVSNNLRSK